MRMSSTLALASFALGLSIVSPLAADLITIPTSSNRALPLVEAAGFDWSGFYAGVYGVSQSSESDDQIGLGINAGINAQFDFYLLGAEVAVQGLAGGIGETTSGQILGRAGLVVADNVLVYGAGGYGLDLGSPQEQDILAGGGLELAVSEDISVRAQYLHAFPVQGENATNQFTVGAAFHF